MNILVTGGAGYIGSHTCVELLKNNHSVIIADNLINSKRETVDKIKEISGKDISFYEIDVTDESLVEKVFNENKIDGVIHFAGLKAVGESVEKPLLYYYNNLVSTMVLSKACIKHNVNKFIFSSSATVYGDNISPLDETMELRPTTNPYGETKAMSEKILKDTVYANSDFTVSLLRYFNPVGAHESGLIGEDPNGTPNNLMPFITKVAKGELKELKIFGDDYETVDGTGVRDYIHVVDLAEGHVKAIENLEQGVYVYNLGTGRGTSVLELVTAFKDANNIDIPYKIVERRAGDLAISYANVFKAKNELDWTTKRDIRDMCIDAWRFEKMNSKKRQ